MNIIRINCVNTSPEKALWERLSGFGLNPTEWVVRRLQTKFFYAINRLDPSLVLIGEAKTTTSAWDWHSLELCEL